MRHKHICFTLIRSKICQCFFPTQVIGEEKGFQGSKGEEKNSDRHAVFDTPAQAFCGRKKNALR